MTIIKKSVGKFFITAILGQYSRIDPASITVPMSGATREAEEALLEGTRRRIDDKEVFTPYSQFAITAFPSYITRAPGKPPSYCHRERPIAPGETTA